MIIWILYFVLAALLMGSLYLTLLNLPGLWIMVAGVALYAACTHFAYAGWKTLFALLVLAGSAEAIDFVAGAAGATKAGASRRGLWGALIGGIIGGIFFTIPLPVVGTIVGICIGTLAGAIFAELWGGAEVMQSMKIGVGAAWGRFLGILAKLLFGCTIFATALIAALPIHGSKSAPPAPARAAIPAKA